MMLRKSVLFVLVLIPFFIQCQPNRKGAELNIVQDPDEVAQFPGGAERLREFIETNFEWEQSQLTVEGKVLVSFVVKSSGEIANVTIEKSLCETCDAEAIRLVKMMPSWIPAQKDEVSVDSKMVIPISFSL